ncbi:armadillo repeat domain-containing protein [Didymella exigua CBS 183.55]|uniref:Armadillo repeat domain-containing protein n=1 Tax=Didymella exigua CBS 183.55 TaxID=1150837 RepID=A0A6A5RFQ5_9PLEO|nr:armadillo repeat domain-containing protein [Didymella exigua CBS 183.55]KAF1926572.1 armadillo repeat domain-containing protein [Didymella exigua CBS 183.55]
MGRSTIPSALAELSNPTSSEAQVIALRNLKNEIVGHEQRKELAVTYGVVRPLAGLLREGVRRGGKRRHSNGTTQEAHNGADTSSRPAAASRIRSAQAQEEWRKEDDLRFQATLVVGSLANGGPAFTAPLLAGHVLPPMLETLRLGETPNRVLTTTLMTLNQIVDAVAQEKPGPDTNGTSLAAVVREQVYTRSVVENIAEILAQTAGSSKVNQQVLLAIQLLIKTCVEDAHKKVLVDAGILDILAVKLASIAAADDSVPQTDSTRSQRENVPSKFLSEIVEAIAAIIKGSHFYAARFLYSQPIQQLFGWPKERTSAAYDAHSSSKQSSWDKLIPRVQTITSKTDPYTKSWPALGSYTAVSGESYARLPSMETTTQSSNRSVITDESESPLFIWLMYVARRGEGAERLSVCYLLALLKNFGEKWPLNDPSKVIRERHFSYLVIPLVVKMIEESSEQAKKAHTLIPAARDEVRFVLERSPLVLAELVTGNKALQTAAVDAHVMPILVQILKKSFERVTTNAKPLWKPRAASHEVKDQVIDPESSTLGRSGLSVDILHAFRVRESALLALAAIAGDQDPYRKLVIEMGAATHIIESLVPYSESSEKDGNPDAVLRAACTATRSLSRSVSVLRTSLIDHGIANPVFELLNHQSIKVQIAATEVITNLVLEVSPMRTEIIEAGIMKTLCEHCRSANFDLRHGSIWALKHLCLGIPVAMKIQCLDELGVGFLMQTLNGEFAKPAMGTPNAAGEQVDILNAVDEPHMDVDDDPSSDEDEDTMTDAIPSMRRHQRPGSRYTSATNIHDRLQQIKNDELDPRTKLEREEQAIQMQSLDFIRNFCAEEKKSGEMIDHLLKTYGHSRFFEMLDSKIRPKIPSPASSQPQMDSPTPSYWPGTTQQRPPFPSSPSTQPNWSTYHSNAILKAAIFILVHLANGRPHHRTLLLGQTTLMRHLLPLFSHPARDVRLGCAWMVINLVWVEDHTEEAPTRERARVLREMGFEAKVNELERDPDLDVRERAKTATDVLGRMNGEGGERRGGSGYASPSQAFGMEGLRGLQGWGRESRG